MATVVEVHTTMVIIHPNSLNITPAMPDKVVKGINTTTITSVVAITDIHTSLVAYMAASLGEEPRSICLVMFSNTTMASSTTIPMAILKEHKETMFKELSTTLK